MTLSLARASAAEALGSALLVATVVGSGIMAERLAGGNVALALLGDFFDEIDATPRAVSPESDISGVVAVELGGDA